jgi:DNA-binding NtrC family response regulator
MNAEKSLNILLVDDEEIVHQTLAPYLRDLGYVVERADDGNAALTLIEKSEYDLALVDVRMPGMDGMELLGKIQEIRPELSAVIMTGHGSMDLAVQALRVGAADFLTKPVKLNELDAVLEKAYRFRELRKKEIRLRETIGEIQALQDEKERGRAMIAESEAMKQVKEQVRLAVEANCDTILITGETGTGKELVAKAIHANSPRADQMFVAVNSGSLPPDLLESTLFGHVRGAFTSAIQSKKGYFEVADRGTIFFDEIGTLGPETQIKLLRVIQEKEFTALGATDPVKVDVRILAATNADLHQLVKEGKFREDLYYRLNVINIALPPLRERREDIPLLAGHFFTYYCRENNKFLDQSGRSILQFQPEALQVLMEHAWPGNVRELENVVERAVVLATEQSVPVEVLPDALLEANGIRRTRGDGAPLPADASLFEIVNDFERRVIMERLEHCSGSQTDAAESLHVPLSTLNQKIKRLDIKIRKKSES